MRSVPHFINGARVEESGHSPVFNPATGEVIAKVPVASGATIEEVVEIARLASQSWGRSSLSRRTKILFTLRQLLVEHTDELATLITTEHGKTDADAKGEIARALENVEYACGLIEHLKGGFSDQVAEGVDVHSTREPVGVVVAVTPFNFPIMVPLWMSANAIASGNVVILKPSERDPSVSVRLAELFEEAGLPHGVFNVLQGNATTVQALLEHPGVDAVSFVGSTPVARAVHESASRHHKRVQALGGAKNHMVVLPDADLDVAADAAINAGYGSAGERCMAISVVVTVGDVADPLIKKITERLDRLKVGPGDDPASDFGPLITKEHLDRVVSYVTSAPLFSRQVHVGMIGVNVPIPVPISAYSFGGWKDSIFGDAHIYGTEGFAFYTRAKVVTTRWPQPPESQIDLGFPTTR